MKLTMMLRPPYSPLAPRPHLVIHRKGNRLEAEGTKALSPGLARNRSLMYLSLADNGIGSGDADVAALDDFRDAMMSCPTLTHIDLLYNRIGERGARVR